MVNRWVAPRKRCCIQNFPLSITIHSQRKGLNVNKTATISAVVCVLFCSTVKYLHAVEPDSTIVIGFKSSGYVYWENFRLWKSDYSGTSDKVSKSGGDISEGDWFNSVLGGFVLENTMSEHLTTRVALEASFNRPFPETNNEVSRVTRFNTYVHEAKALYSFRDQLKFPTQVEVGYFLYDYNPDQQNLGEYLFRSKIYPLNLFTNFELPQDRLLGIRVGTSWMPNFHQDLLLTSEYKYAPKSDYTLSYVASYSMGKVLTLGAGASCEHCLAVKPSLESPKNENNMYVTVPAQNFKDSAGVTHKVNAADGLPGLVKNDTNYSYQSNPVTLSRDFYPQLQVDTGYYTFQGIALMGRFSFDPKALFGSSRGFGRQDLKLYGETAILGLKDYPFYYSSLKQRIPWMLGFNLPAFNYIDVVSLEVEYCSNPFPNDWQRSLREGLPIPGGLGFIPGTYVDPATHSDYVYSPWKWSVYLRKQVAHGLYISTQIAHDHLRLPNVDGFTYEELLKDRSQWWGILRVTASY